MALFSEQNAIDKTNCQVKLGKVSGLLYISERIVCIYSFSCSSSSNSRAKTLELWQTEETPA